MRGRIKVYNDEKGYGFILGINNKDYFFHISEIKFCDKVERGNFVEFMESNSEKGLVAKNIEVSQTKKFIAFDDVRIKLSNIKNYGIRTWDEEYEYTFTKEEMKRRESERKERDGKFLTGVQNTVSIISLINAAAGGEFGWVTPRLEPTEKRKMRRKKLYVTTYQNDNYEFYDNEVRFDIDKKLKELDEQLG